MKNSKITEQEVEQARKQMREMMDVVTPKHLYDYLNEHVIGQDEAKKIISVVIYNHYKRFCDSIFGYTKGMKNNPYEDVTIEKTSALILGNTGSGKTYMLRMLANYLNIPFYIQDSCTLSESGYVGDDTEVKLRIELLYADLTTSSFGITNEGYTVCVPDNGSNVVVNVPATTDITRITPTSRVEHTPVYVYATPTGTNNQMVYSTSYYPIEVANTRRGTNALLDKFKAIPKSAIHAVETYVHPGYGDLSLVSGISDTDKELKTIYDSNTESWYSDGSTNQVVIKQTISANNVLLKGYLLNWRNTDIDNIPDTWTLSIRGLDEYGNENTVVFDSVDRYYPFYSVEDDDIVYHCKFDNPLVVKEITLTLTARTNRKIALNKLFLYC